MNRKRTARPKWAKHLTASDWKHLKEGQKRNVPTLPNLQRDAETCDDCKWILARVERTKNGEWWAA
jgi:hypothetical protein